MTDIPDSIGERIEQAQRERDEKAKCRWFHKWTKLPGFRFAGPKRLLAYRCLRCEAVKEVRGS